MITPQGIENLKCQGANLTDEDDTSCDLPACPPGHQTCSPCPKLPCAPCPVQHCYQDVLSWNPYDPLPRWSGPTDLWPWSAGGGLDRGSGLPASLPVPAMLHETM